MTALVATETSRDLAAAEVAAAGFLEALGIELQTEHLRATPGRMARAWAEMLTPREFDATTFPNNEGYDELVLARDIPFRSVCERQLQPAAVGVVLRAEHSCMTLRGVQATGSSTVTSSLLGSLRSDPRSRQEFLTLASS